MVNYILRRLLISIVVLLGIGMVSFTVIQLPPGDFASSYKTYLINQGGMTEDEAEAAANMVRVRYGLDQPVPIQFFNWIKGIVTEGKFGFSFAYRKDVGELIAERLPRTLMLALLAHAISTVVGLALVSMWLLANTAWPIMSRRCWLLSSPRFPAFCWPWSLFTCWYLPLSRSIPSLSFPPSMYRRPGRGPNWLISSSTSGRLSLLPVWAGWPGICG